jgi:hypothetical protein
MRYKQVPQIGARCALARALDRLMHQSIIVGDILYNMRK